MFTKDSKSKLAKPLKPSLKRITNPAELLMEKIKSLDTTFRLADDVMIENNKLSKENIDLKEKIIALETALKQKSVFKGEINFCPNSKQLDELKQGYEERIKVLSKNTGHWKEQTNNLMNKYYPLIKELKEMSDKP